MPLIEPHRRRYERTREIRIDALARLGILLFAGAPLVSVLIASAIAQLNGCTLNEAAAHPCIVLGVDWSGLIDTMFM